MHDTESFFMRLYRNAVLRHPRLILFLIVVLVGVFSYHASDFKLDASADSLVLENDEDLQYFRQAAKKYSSGDFLVITYTPKQDLLSKDSLEGIRALREDLLKLEQVESVISILDVPLINSPKISFSEMADGIRTLETPGVDLELARKEFHESPVYGNLLVSPNGKTTALQVNLKRDDKYYELIYRRNDLREKKSYTTLTPEEQKELERVALEFKAYLAESLERQNRFVQSVRDIIDKQRHHGDLFLGGVPMITADMIDYIRHDLETFGFGVLLFMVIALVFFFRKTRWVVLPVLCCGIVAWSMLGYLGWVDWRVTVISSNFVSILLIITMSITIHLIVRFNELHAESPGKDATTLTLETLQHMFIPCFYTAITTIVAFSSLVVSDIRPVIDFGWMMTFGIVLGFILTFLILPISMSLMDPGTPGSTHDRTKALTSAIASFTKNNGKILLTLCSVLAVLAVTGVTRLNVENRFIDNFKEHTEIYQGMEVIDRQLGGTMPLDIIINADAEFYRTLEESAQAPKEEVFDDPFAEEGDNEPPNFWFHPDPLNQVEAIHDYLEQLDQVGKVQSIATAIKVVKIINDGKLPDDYDLAVIRKLLPEEINKALVRPYMSDDANQVRITMRLIEAAPELNRNALMNKIKTHLVENMGIEADRIRLTGMAVLYNNMLYSLYNSQIVTLGFVFVAILVMFIILFRNVLLATLAIFPNVLAAGLVLGIMGWFRIPLDMMTITIAAITIGIAVDDTIHYVHRFREEFAVRPDYDECIDRCHGSIGRAIYYTSITVTVGFSILALSNFIPTIVFGLLTGLAMVIALIFNLTLLPLLIKVVQPLGKAGQ